MRKKMLRYRMFVFLFAMLMPIALYAQELNINGTITDAEFGEALIGVTVQIEGTTTGTTTNMDGTYTIRAFSGQTLMFSYIGYNVERIVLDNQTQIDLAMTVSTEMLEDVIVIGYGTTTKDDATGSVAVVGSDDFNLGAISSPQELVTGKIAGVRITNSGGMPGAGSTIRIRGGSSMSASNDPLFVIDGVPVDNNGISGMANPLSSINPDDIESFTVLKDASATAIYGSRASNGVIIITTKKGKVGRPMSINYSGNVSAGIKSSGIDVLTANEFRAMIEERYADNQSVIDIMGDASTDWQQEIFQTALGHDHNLSISGALDNLPYRASVGYTGQEGILKTSAMDRITGSINLNPSFLDDHLTFNLNAKGVNMHNQFANQGAIGTAIEFDPTQPVHSDNSIYDTYGGYFTWLNMVDTTRNTLATSNPVALLEQREDISTVNRVIANLQMNYKFHFLPEMSLNMNVGMDQSKSSGEINVPETAAFGEDLSRGNGEMRVYDQSKRNTLFDTYLNYKKEFGDSRLDAMVGYSWQHFHRNNSDSALNAAGTLTIDPWNDFPTESYLVSFFGRVNYTLKDRYLFTFTLRNDHTSRFSPETRSGLFPSAAFAWDISDESFMANINEINNLKLRLGYGVTGQQNITSGDYPYLPVYTLGIDNAAYQFGSDYVLTYRPQGYDANIKWEETVTYNIGLDYGVLRNRFSGALELYYRQTNDLINTIPVPAGSNLTNELLTNVGNLTNKGVEFDINAKVISTSNVLWELGFNATYNVNELTKLTATDDPDYPGVYTGGISGGVGNNVQIHSVDHPVSSFYVYEQAYDAEGNALEGLYVDRNEDGLITIDDRYQYNSPAPTVFMGFSSNLNYKNFDFRFGGRINLGNYVYNNVDSRMALLSNLYTPSNYLTNVPTFINNSMFTNEQFWSDYYVRNASFLRLDNVSLGYTFKNVFNDSNIRVYGSIQNVIVITAYDGIDPEIEGGIDNNLYPRPTTYMLGLSIDL